MRPCELTPITQVTVGNTAVCTRNVAVSATRHLVTCIKNKRPCTLDNLDLDEEFPDDFNVEERDQVNIPVWQSSSGI